MSEYWKSTPRYWCKHCKVFIRDTPLERSNHEATGKHQGSLRRFLRDVHRSQQKDEKEGQRAKGEVERLKGVIAQPEGSSQPPWRRGTGGNKNAPGSSGSGANTSTLSSRAATEEARRRQMGQLAEMGVAIPEEFRSEMALAGEWTTISEKVITSDGDGSETPALNIGVRKRKRNEREGGGGGDKTDEEEEPEAEAEESGATRGATRRGERKVWGSTLKGHPGSLVDEKDEELDALLGMTKDLKGKRKVKEESIVNEEDIDRVKEEDVEESAVKKEEDNGELGAINPTPDADETLQKGMARDDLDEDNADKPSIKEMASESVPSEPQPAVVFKKRKPKQIRR